MIEAIEAIRNIISMSSETGHAVSREAAQDLLGQIEPYLEEIKDSCTCGKRMRQIQKSLELCDDECNCCHITRDDVRQTS